VEIHSSADSSAPPFVPDAIGQVENGCRPLSGSKTLLATRLRAVFATPDRRLIALDNGLRLKIVGN